MSDPRLVTPQRVVPDGGACAVDGGHRYWCWKRVTGAALLVLLVLGLVAGLWWWTR